MKIIINADDYGKNSMINQAIVEAFNKKYITNTTIMANMEGYDEAVLLAKENNFFDKVGLHLNFFYGNPLSNEMKNNSYFTQNGVMTDKNIVKSVKAKFILPKKQKLAIQMEAKKQMEKYIESGFSEMHIDSHYHCHTIFSLYRGGILVEAKQKNFRTIRLSLNLTVLKKRTLIKIYKKFFNASLRKNFKTTTYFTSAKDFVEIAKRRYDPVSKQIQWKELENCICEIMVHPAYDENGKLVNLYDGTDFEELFKYIDESQLISYKDL